MVELKICFADKYIINFINSEMLFQDALCYCIIN